ncbi:hypothetical protein L873DRAFT_229482 [Choiromyces venosus 120613-1]|uniref:Uncharacterized protein n=1 Tax=Choiromyces venosus 120613-1 TaxID=1336337 RepID=A0A3N4JYJ3_9PEZI|nr:hypothetical protein L873DRAFT_229482 [Choiromyces venosus 120613-1]
MTATQGFGKLYIDNISSLSTTTQMFPLNIFGFNCNAISIFCCTRHITQTSRRTEVQEAPITSQPPSQEPMNANPSD